MFKHLIFTILLFVASSQVVDANVIRSFDADYHVRADGIVEVTEQIVFDFESEERRGIFRTIHKEHPQVPTAWYRNRFVEIEILSVTRDGTAEMFQVTDSRNQLSLRIGNPDVTISGPHTYQITYRLTGALSYGEDGAELYWDVTGNEWAATIESVITRVTGESDFILDQFVCYQGSLGMTATCTSAERTGTVITFKADYLLPGEGLTIGVALNSASVSFVTTERVSFLPFGVMVSVLWLAGFGWWVYRFRTKAKTGQTIIAQYEPYQDYLPMYTGTLYNKRLDPHDVTAGVLFLAEQGFIKIKRIERKIVFIFTDHDYELSLERPIEEMPSRFLQFLARIFFSDNGLVKSTVLLSEVAKQNVKNAKSIKALERDIKQDLLTHGYLTTTFPTFGWVGKAVLALAGVGWIGFALLVEGGAAVLIFVVSSTVALYAIATMPRFTAKGYAAQDHLRGFKQFLSVTDKERFTFHNAPAKEPELFMRYLPYAIALKVEKEWAEVFAGVTIPQPDWFEGGGMNAFSATALTKDIGAFSTSFTSSSGTSGSSGGGSVGGGGGGGGGGSW